MTEQRNINTESGQYNESHFRDKAQQAGRDIDNRREYKALIFEDNSSSNDTINQTIVNVNISLSDPLDHQQLEQYQALQNIFQKNPVLLSELDNTSFEPQKIKNSEFALARTKHISLEANLPIMFSAGECKLRFSTITLRGITLIFKHKDILTWFMTGLGLAVSSKTRLFLYQDQDDQSKFCFSAGNSTFFLSQEEASELCECVDFVINAYKDVMISEEKAFKSYYLPIESIPNFQVKLLSVPKILWDLMIHFKKEYSKSLGNSEWHIFESDSGLIQIESPSVYVEHIILFGKVDDSSNQVNVMRASPFFHIHCIEKEQEQQWIDYISEYRIWDAEYSKMWLKDRFIPRVIQEYWDGLFATGREVINQWVVETSKEQPMASLAALKLNDLIKWIDDIEDWSLHLRHRIISINSECVIDYYRDVTNLILESSIKDRNLSYPEEKLSWILAMIDPKTTQSFYKNASSKEDLIKKMLHYHSTRLEPGVMECMDFLNSISRAFGWLISCTDPEKSIVQVNRAHRSTEKLWEIAYFEKRHILD